MVRLLVNATENLEPITPIVRNHVNKDY